MQLSYGSVLALLEGETMIPSRTTRRWLYLVPLLALLLIVGGAAYAINQAAAAGIASAQAPPVAVQSLQLGDNPDSWDLQPGEMKVLPNGVTVRRDMKHD